MHPNTHLLFDNRQVVISFIASFIPLLGYVVNSFLARLPEHVKAFVHVVLAAAGGAIYDAIVANNFGWNWATGQVILTAVVAALAAHHLLWKPATVNAILGRPRR